MYRHEWFDLWLHSQDELAAILGSPILTRETLHQWPLSCVQQIRTTDGQRWIYKTQTGPTVEAAFYERARSYLLLPAQTIGQQNGHVMMLLPFVDAPLLHAQAQSETDLLQTASAVVAQIATISGDPPYLYDIGGPDQWRMLVEATCHTLHNLVSSGQFTQVTASMIDQTQRQLLAEPVCTATGQESGLVHGDLTGDNIFVIGDGRWYVIDWARPVLGPTDTDLANLLESLGIDPLRHVSHEIMTILYGMRIQWFAQCAAQWFPAGAPTYDAQIAELMRRLDTIRQS